MSTAALHCLSSTVCVSLPEPIHPCAFLPPSDPDVGLFPEVYNRIQQFKLSKPTWTDYTERCLGGGTTKDQDTTDGWIIPVVAVVVSLILLIPIIVAIKKCHNAKSSTKERFNSYHDMYVVVGPDKEARGVNSETVMGNNADVIVNHSSVSVEDEASRKREENRETSDSGITCEVELQISPISGTPEKSQKHLEQDELCPEADITVLALDNESFVKDNGNTEHQTPHLTKHTNSADEQNGLQQTSTLDQREQDVSDTASVELRCVSSQMDDIEGDKDKAQSESNNSDIPIIRESLNIKTNSSTNPSNYTDLQPQINNLDSHGSSDIENTDDSDYRTPEYENGNSYGLQKHPNSTIKTQTLSDGFNGTLEMDPQFNHNSEGQLIPNGATSPGVESDIKPCFEAYVTDHTDDQLGTEDGIDGTVDMRFSNGYSDNDSIRTSGTSDSRKSDLRTDLMDYISSSLQ